MSFTSSMFYTRPGFPDFALAVDQRSASSLPCLARTLSRTGTGTASMTRRKMNPFRMLPVISDIRPTAAGPTKDADLSVRANREKKDDSWSCRVSFERGL